jgi:hypothetical protein
MLSPIPNRLRSNLARFLSAPIAPAQPQALQIPNDLRVEANGSAYDQASGHLDYLWFEITEQLDDGQRRYFKVVRLAMLTYLPDQEREQSTVLIEMQKALKAVNTAQIDLVCLSANILEPDLGVVQIYGAQAAGRTLDEAVSSSTQSQAVVIATLRAAYEQSIFQPLTREIGEWLRTAFERMAYALVVRGQPDPRINIRGPQVVDALKSGTRQSEVGLQQNEYLYRGMVAGQHEFANVVLISRAGDDGRHDLYQLQERLATEMSIWGSKIQFTNSLNVGIAIPVALQGLIAHAASSGYSAGEGHSLQRSQGESIGQAHSDGVSESDVWGRSTSTGESWSTAHTSGRAETTGSSISHSTGVADGVSHSVGSAHTVGDTNSSSSGTSTTHGVAAGESHVDSQAQNWSNGVAGGGTISAAPLGLGASGSLGLSHSDGGSIGMADGVSSSVMDSTTNINMTSHAHSEATTSSVADGTSHSTSQGQSLSTSHSISNMESDTQAHGTSISQTNSYAHGTGSSQSDTRSASQFGSQGSADSIGLSRSQALSASMSSGIGLGLVPSIGFGKSYQGIDYVAKAIHDALLQQYRLIETMALEGGVFVDNYFLVPTPEARAALKGLITQAFHGVEEVATPVQVMDLTPEEESYIRLHAQICVPSTMPERSPWALEGWRHTTLVTLLQAATYIAPGLFEHGAALTTLEPMPPFANVATHFRNGVAHIGQLVSQETGEVRRAEVRLTAPQLFAHWLIAADTRFGKTVYAMRIVHEMLQQKTARVIVGDFAAGWRDLLSVVNRREGNRFEYGSLYPNSPRPLSFNCLRVGPHIDAESTLNAIVDLTTNAGQLGERQSGFLLKTLRDLYLEHGVLTEDDWVLDDLSDLRGMLLAEANRNRNRSTAAAYRAPQAGEHQWGWLKEAERELINQRRMARSETPLPDQPIRLRDLHPDPVIARSDRHVIAMHRSRRVTIKQWVARLTELRDSLKRLTTSYDSIQGILNRLARLAEGELGRMLSGESDSLAIEELVWPQGLAVLEAGAGGHLSDFAKVLLISIIVWRVYTDAVRRWEQSRETGEVIPQTVIVLEEANKIFGGALDKSSDNAQNGPQISELLAGMYRDAAKYGITFIGIGQSPAEFPAAVITSSNNIAVSRLKGDRDAKTAMAALGYSPMGFHDNPYFRFIAGGIPATHFITKLGLNTDRTRIAPFVLQPLALHLSAVTDADLRAEFSFGA